MIHWDCSVLTTIVVNQLCITSQHPLHMLEYGYDPPTTHTHTHTRTTIRAITRLYRPYCYSLWSTFYFVNPISIPKWYVVKSYHNCHRSKASKHLERSLLFHWFAVHSLSVYYPFDNDIHDRVINSICFVMMNYHACILCWYVLHDHETYGI